MKKIIGGLAAIAIALGAASGAAAAPKKDNKGSSGRQLQTRGMQDIPRCSRQLGAMSVVEPDTQWWRDYNLGTPENIIKVFVQQSLLQPGQPRPRHAEPRDGACAG